MWSTSKKWIFAMVLLGGCVQAPHSKLIHEVTVITPVNDFMQTRQAASWSIQASVDHQGNRWPEGLTLGGQAVRYHDGRVTRALTLRKDEISPESFLDAHQRARQTQAQLRQHCTTTTLSLDGRQLELLATVTVRALAGRKHMPVPPTDSDPDLVEAMVARNGSDRVVVSTRLEMKIDESTWARLGSVQMLEYELCGEAGVARQEELEGLAEVVSKTEALKND